MGKKGKKAQKLSKASNETVSIVTPTVKGRVECLKICADCIIAQTAVSKIIQWVIVSADKTWTHDAFHTNVLELQTIIKSVAPNLKIDAHYINDALVKSEGWPESSNYEAIGYLRNITNKIAKGE